MINQILKLILIMFFIGIIFSCKKNNDELVPLKDNCLVSEVSDSNDVLTYSIKYINDKVSEIVGYNSEGMKIVEARLDYQDDTINYDWFYENDTIRKVLILGNNGYVKTQISFDTIGIENKIDTTDYYYNSEKYLIKKITNKHLLSNPQEFDWYGDSSVYTIIDGNITSKFSSSSNHSSPLLIEYYLDKPNWTCISSDPPYIEVGLNHLFGKESKNLIKRISRDELFLDFSYKLNELGYVTEMKTDGTEGKTILKINYECK